MQSPHKRKISVFKSQMVHLLNRNFVVKIRIPVNVNSKDLLSKARKNTKVQTFKKDGVKNASASFMLVTKQLAKSQKIYINQRTA